jgi:hypothetical protein
MCRVLKKELLGCLDKKCRKDEKAFAANKILRALWLKKIRDLGDVCCNFAILGTVSALNSDLED